MARAGRDLQNRVVLCVAAGLGDRLGFLLVMMARVSAASVASAARVSTGSLGGGDGWGRQHTAEDTDQLRRNHLTFHSGFSEFTFSS